MISIGSLTIQEYDDYLKFGCDRKLSVMKPKINRNMLWSAKWSSGLPFKEDSLSGSSPDQSTINILYDDLRDDIVYLKKIDNSC
jgi:hypothetical protein